MSVHYVEDEKPTIVFQLLKAIGKGWKYPLKEGTIQNCSNLELKGKNTSCNNCEKWQCTYRKGPKRIKRRERAGGVHRKRREKTKEVAKTIFVGCTVKEYLCVCASAYACAVGKKEGVCSLGDSGDGLLGNHPS